MFFQTTIKTAVTATSLAIISAATPVSAQEADNHYNDRHTEPVPVYNPNDPEFRKAHPMRVYVNLNGKKRHAKRLAYRGRTLANVRYNLPSYAVLVDDPEYADITIRARLQDYDLNFRVIDVDSKDKKYKKSRRYTGGKCGTFRRAYYTRVKEKGEAYAAYNIRVRVKDYGTFRDRVRLRAAENFSYGKNLRARTNCGIAPTGHFPSNKVEKLFYKSNPKYRDHVAREIREEAADVLGRELARRIHRYTDDYYHTLATNLSDRNRYGRSRRDSHDDEYEDRNYSSYRFSYSSGNQYSARN